ncbi:biogenesis of lysosome-related organelles complex 1 subunit 2-like isoform X2 [Antedon mediterranea]|uniref:biogenesis of lysosome-related organelles complex 1 subunit 2-like isoform X2 n=1 Tax=Antedon mediterranea TaxID=105859 RepID=UPI003AF51746
MHTVEDISYPCRWRITLFQFLFYLCPYVVDDASDALEETKEPDLKELSHDMFAKAAIYLRGDLAATADDYKLLEKMNIATSKKYSQMKDFGVDIHRALSDLNEKYRNLQPFLDQIDQVEESVGNLEQAAYRLDAYSRRLELKFKQLEKR